MLVMAITCDFRHEWSAEDNLKTGYQVLSHPQDLQIYVYMCFVADGLAWEMASVL